MAKKTIGLDTKLKRIDTHVSVDAGEAETVVLNAQSGTYFSMVEIAAEIREC